MNTTHYVVTQPGLAGDPRLAIARLGIHEAMPPQIVHRPSGNTDYLFMLFHTPAVVGAAPGAADQPANTFILWEPGQSHCYGSARRHWDHSWIHFAGSTVARLVRDTRGVPRNRPVPLAQPHLFERFLEAVHGEIAGHGRPDPVIIANTLHTLLRELARALAGGGEQLVPDEFSAVKGYLDTHYQLPLRLTDLAGRTFLSVPRFCALFKRYYGRPAIDYVVGLRMQHAAFMLRDVNLRVKQVAESVGYSDLYHFSKLFRKRYGVSPRAYRRGV